MLVSGCNEGVNRAKAAATLAAVGVAPAVVMGTTILPVVAD